MEYYIYLRINREIYNTMSNKPVVWNKDRPLQVYRLALLGATDREMADAMLVSPHTFDFWKRTRPEFLDMLNRGKIDADAKVAEALFKKATGFWEDEVHITVLKNGQTVKTVTPRYYPPDPWASARWLALRRKMDWTEVQRIESKQTVVNINKFDFSGLTSEELRVIRKAGLKQLEQNIGDN